MVNNKNEENIAYKQIQKYIVNKYNVKVSECAIAEVLRKYNLTTRGAFNSKLNSKPKTSSETHLKLIEKTLIHFQII